MIRCFHEDLQRVAKQTIFYYTIPSNHYATLVLYSEKDQQSQLRNLEEIYKKFVSSDKRFMKLDESGHVITVNMEQSQANEALLVFVKAHV